VPTFTDEVVIICCRKGERFLTEIQMEALRIGRFQESPVRQFASTNDYRMDHNIIRFLNADVNVPMATMDAFCQYVNFE
jgi:hypothetical protein